MDLSKLFLLSRLSKFHDRGKRVLSSLFLRLQRCTHKDASSDIVKPELNMVMDARFNKGLAFTMKERQLLGVHGLWPCSYRSMTEQLFAVKANFDARKDPVAKFTYLLSLRGRHERLFFRFISTYTEEVMPIIYTPTVGTVCSTFGLLFRAPMGLYITYFDRGHVQELLRNWRVKDVRGICVTDGGRILGLGDLGASGMGISVGKLALYTALGGVPPQKLLPISLDVGTDNEELLADPLYVGARIKRVKGDEYDELVQEVMDALVTCYGNDVFIHFEDFATPNAFKFIRKYQQCYCSFNDDIQGTGATALAGFLGVERLTKRELEDHIFLFVGTGSASIGTVLLLAKELQQRGVDKPTIHKNIYLYDINGLVTLESPNLVDDIRPYAKDQEPLKELFDVVEQIKPSIMIGATGVGGLFTEQVLRSMAKHHERPAVFALSNPTNKAECTAEQAYTFTEGRVIFCSGSPFPPVLINEKRYTPGQANNCLVFPGIALGVLCSRARHVPDEIYTLTAHVLADFTSEENIAAGSVYPALKDATEVSFTIGVHVATYIIEHGLSNLYPLPEDICEFVYGYLYRFHYEQSIPSTWKYPELPHVPLEPNTKVQKQKGFK